jgi:hypothetical protein
MIPQNGAPVNKTRLIRCELDFYIEERTDDLIRDLQGFDVSPNGVHDLVLQQRVLFRAIAELTSALLRNRINILIETIYLFTYTFSRDTTRIRRGMN